MPPPYAVPEKHVLTARQIATLVNQHSWFPDWKTNPAARKNFETAIAVALAESSGDITAKNGDHYGLYQIGYGAHKDLFDVRSDPSVPGTGLPGTGFRDPYDPDDNVNMAQAVYKQAGNSWSPWTAYTSGAYTKYMSDAGKAAGTQVTIDNGGADDSNFIDKGLTKGKNAVDALNPANWIPSVLKFLRDSGIVIGASLLALTLLVLGIWLLIRNTALGDAAKSAGKAGLMAAVPEAAPAIAAK